MVDARPAQQSANGKPFAVAMGTSIEDAAGLKSKRAPPDPRGPTLELLQAFGLRDRNAYYDGKVRGKVLRLDNLKQLSSAGVVGGKGSGRRSALSGYGGARHRRCATKAADELEDDAQPAPAAQVGEALASPTDEKPPTSGSKGKKAKPFANLRYQDFEALREFWVAYIDDLKPGSGAALAEVLASADLHGSTLRVAQAKNPGCVRLQGTVIEETQRTFRIITRDDRVRVLPKENCIFEVTARGETISMLGPAWAHRLPGGVPGPLAPSVWSVTRPRLSGTRR